MTDSDIAAAIDACAVPARPPVKSDAERARRGDKTTWRWFRRRSPAATGLVSPTVLAGQGSLPTDENLLRTIMASGPVRMSDLAAWQGVDK